MKVYMPLKPMKYGFKMFLLSESNTTYVLGEILMKDIKVLEKMTVKSISIEKVIREL